MQKVNGNRYQLKWNQNINLRIAKAALKAWDSCKKSYFQKESRRDKTVQRQKSSYYHAKDLNDYGTLITTKAKTIIQIEENETEQKGQNLFGKEKHWASLEIKRRNNVSLLGWRSSLYKYTFLQMLKRMKRKDIRFDDVHKIRVHIFFQNWYSFHAKLNSQQKIWSYT